MKYKLLLLVIFILCMMYGCVYIHMTHLSNEDLEWTNSIPRYSEITLRSNDGRTASIKYMDFFINNSTDRFYISAAGGTTYEANAGYSFEIKDSMKTLSGIFIIHRVVKGNNLWYRAKLGARSTIEEYDFVRPLVTRHYTIGNHIINDCVIIDSLNSEYISDLANYPYYHIEKFVISKEYGLIYYKREDGEEFFRQDLLPDSIQMKKQL
ncbi:hypothetical protein [uncultured Muribaculum sp.]|uniref:hypothetical protein n=1 Tax=uncultured Muribaculum sp. TaxID=1918613 RepID=UPI0026364934|nr:hypothetical protein [uncultured Muribaculum sp.]